VRFENCTAWFPHVGGALCCWGRLQTCIASPQPRGRGYTCSYPMGKIPVRVTRQTVAPVANRIGRLDERVQGAETDRVTASESRGGGS
ncbi:hypothetical protein GOODEAATRI_027696, partial [Goodea atripinnis]